MPSCLHFYVDESGSRYPDHKPAEREGARDFFAMGGILLEDEQEGHARALHADLCARWKIRKPLHSVDIRHGSKQFGWLRRVDEDERIRFYSAVHALVKNSGAIALACVIHRPGYNARYKEKYGDQRWQLCKTAFTIALERAARVALDRGRKLRVYVESAKGEDEKVRRYYKDLKAGGNPFEPATSAKYAPLNADQFSSVLYDIKFKSKKSEMVQLADLVLYPIARGGYEPDYIAYKKMMEDRCVIDCHLDASDLPQRGVKYSCFDGPAFKK